MFKKNIIGFLLFFAFISSTTFGQKIWNESTSKSTDDVVFIASHLPNKYELFSADLNILKFQLKTIQKREILSVKNSNIIINFPNENGKMQRFRILESSLLSDGLALKYPMIKTYIGQGVNDPTATLRMSIAADGIHVMIMAAGKPALMIDPYTRNRSKYIVYSAADLPKLNDEFSCEFENDDVLRFNNTSNKSERNATDGILRTYRLAVATTIEYSAFHLTNQGIPGGASLAVKKAAVLSAIVNTINRVEGIYEKEFSVRFNIIANNDLIIFIDADNFSNSNAGALIGESQTVIDTEIGNANYDVGHTFSTGGGGLASLGGICTVDAFGATSRKAQAITGSFNPIGDFYDVDFVAHEMGHHFGAHHTYNGQGVGNCTTSTGITAGEPGSGTTIMAYAGICGSLNVQQNSDAYFHTFSLIEINDRLHNTNVLNDFTHPFWAQCALETNTGNNEPTADAGLNFTIPKGTAYALTGNSTDPDGDAITYCWEQIDVQQPTTHPLVSTSTVGPAYRSLIPSSNPKRFMPEFSTVFGGSLANQWEVTPTVARTMNFRLTTRDNRADGGQTNSDDSLITVSGVAGPFQITSNAVNELWVTGETKVITWNVAGTTANGVNEANVEIAIVDNIGNVLSTLIASTPNDGSQSITVPNIINADTKIMVSAINNIFYAVNSGVISLNSVPAYCSTLCNSSGNTQFSDGTTLVQFNTINQSSEGTSAYTDYKAVSTDVILGQTYPITIHANSDGNYVESTRVWIDWNRDCVFDVATEQYDLGETINSPAAGAITSLSPLNIIVPVNASLGETVMRVTSAYSASGNAPLVYRDSCGSGFFGEVEDYTINITDSCPSAGDLIITEIMQNPTGSDTLAEWFEIYNTTALAIDMNGMIIKDDGTNSHTINASLVVPANGFVVLGRNANNGTNGGEQLDYQYSSFTLTNTDDEVVLECNGTEIDAVRYDGGPNFPAPNGKSMSLSPTSFNASDNDTGANWCEATSVFGNGDLGTPGYTNDNCSGNCLGITVTWNGSNWSPINPTIDNPVIITGNYFTQISGNFECCELTINNSILFTIASGNNIKVKNDIINNGQFNVNNQGSVVQVNDNATVTGSGNYVAAINTTVLQNAERFTYFSSVNNTSTLSVFNTFATSNWDYNAVIQEWNYLGNNTATNLMQKGKGYAVQGGSGSIETVTFLGAFNNGIVSQNLYFHADGNLIDNLSNDNNLVGNPYPSAIDAIKLLNQTLNPTSGTLYFWTHNSASVNGSFSTDDYASWNLSGGVQASSGGTAPTGFIASGQGFFMLTEGDENLPLNQEIVSTLTFNNAMRVTNNNDDFRVSQVENNKIWLNIYNNDNVFNQILIAFLPNTTLDHDISYDGKKINNTVATFYSIGKQGQHYGIQALPLFNEQMKIPLGINIANETINTLSISIDHIELFENTTVYLNDKLLNVVHDLSRSDYSFTLSEGEYNNRFELIFNRDILSTQNEFINIESLITTNISETQIVIKTKNSKNISDLEIYDILGKLLYNLKPNKNIVTINTTIKEGTVLYVKAKLENGKTLNSKFIKY